MIYIIIYLFGLIAVGIWHSFKIKTQEDFVVAGRGLSTPILVGTLMATWTGAGSLFSNGRLAYVNGYAALWSSAGSWLGIILIYFIAQKIRRTEKMSVPHILEDRFNKWAALLATVVTIIAYVTIVSYQFKAGGRVINMLAEDFSIGSMSPTLSGIVLTAVFAIAYTMLAGMMSVTYTDVINGIVILTGIALALVYALDKAGGLSGFVDAVPAHKWQVFGAVAADTPKDIQGFVMTPIKALGYFLPTMFLLMGDANMYQRLLSAKSENAARNSVIGWVAAVMAVEILIVSLAFVGSVLEPTLDKNGIGNIILIVANPEFGHVPPAVGYVLLAAIVAVIVSTADSFLLVPATNFSHDIFQRYINPNASQKALLLIGRLTILTMGILAFILASSDFFETILEAAFAAYTVYGAGITPAILAAFIWRGATSQGAVSSILGGAIVTLVWEILPKYEVALWMKDIQTIFPALTVSLLLLVGISLMTRQDD